MRTSAPLSKGELVNHPVRLGIIDALAGKPLTPKQIADRLPDVAQATLYRHINVLLEGEVIDVVSQRQAHGMVECTYALKLGSTHLTREEFAQMSPDDHKGCHALLFARAANALDRYVDQPEYDTTNDGMTYFAAKLFISDDDARQLRLDLIDLMKRYARTTEEPGTKRLVTISSIPEPNP